MKEITLFMMDVENKYRVERLEVTNYMSGWGVIDFDKKAIALENLLNDMFEKGYHFNNIVIQKDNMNRDVDFYVFMKINS